jgi:hypothetical protein
MEGLNLKAIWKIAPLVVTRCGDAILAAWLWVTKLLRQQIVNQKKALCCRRA